MIFFASDRVKEKGTATCYLFVFQCRAEKRPPLSASEAPSGQRDAAACTSDVPGVLPVLFYRHLTKVLPPGRFPQAIGLFLLGFDLGRMPLTNLKSLHTRVVVGLETHGDRDLEDLVPSIVQHIKKQTNKLLENNLGIVYYKI
jgi:hypothetical protein